MAGVEWIWDLRCACSTVLIASRTTEVKLMHSSRPIRPDLVCLIVLFLFDRSMPIKSSQTVGCREVWREEAGAGRGGIDNRGQARRQGKETKS